MGGIEDVVALARNDSRGHQEHGGNQLLDPICSRVPGCIRRRFGVPASRKIRNRKVLDSEIVRYFDWNADVVVGQLSAVTGVPL